MRIIGTGSALPKFVATNQMLSEVMDTSDEWISTRTGIKRRHLLVNQELEEIGVEAIENALKDAGITAKDLDYIICSNTVNEYITPGLGCVLQGHIGATCPSIEATRKRATPPSGCENSEMPGALQLLRRARRSACWL